MKQVKIISDGTALGTKIEACDGTIIPAVEKATIVIQPDAPNRAELIVAFVDVSSETQARFLAWFDGILREVKRIEFADGTTWDAS